ncbi:unnamed protein product [Parajaminaea phylloscopi]
MTSSPSSSSVRSPRPTSPGPRIGPFHIGKEIGKGSFAVVHRGYADPDAPGAPSGESASGQRRDVAIKIVIRRKLTQKLSDNLESEIAILKAVSHPNIVELVECLKTDAHIYLIMDFSSGGDLSQYIRKKGVLPEDDNSLRSRAFNRAAKKYPHPSEGGLHDRVVRSFVEQLASAMEFMRARNIVHRDIKPQNLLLQPPTTQCLQLGHPEGIPQMKVADFGFARSLPAASLAETLCGSPLYMAPEILRHERYDAKADLWSIGAVTYEMIVGKPHFRAANYIELLRRIERNDDRIRFPDERSRATWLREVEKRREAGEAVTAEEEERGPTPVAEDLKTLVRGLLKRHSIERISFEEFFSSSVIQDARPAGAKRSLRESTEGTGVQAIAPLVASPLKPTAGPSLPLQPASSQRVQAPPPLPTLPSLPRFAPKYIVGRDARAEPNTPRRSKDVQVPPQKPPHATPSPELVGKARTGARPSDASPSTSTAAQVAGAGTAATASPQAPLSADEDDDSQYVMVEKRGSEEFTAVSQSPQLALPRTSSGGAQGAMTVAAKLARRPSRLSTTLTSGIHAAVGAVSGGTALTAAFAQQPSSPASASTRQVESSSPRRGAFPAEALSSTPSEASAAAVLGTTPPAAPPLSSSPSTPFALPPGLRRQSFLGRRKSSHGQPSGLGSPRFNSPSPAPGPTPVSDTPNASQPGAAAEKESVVSRPSSSPSTPSGLPQVSSPGSVLARAISNASQKLFGLPSGMSLLGAAALARARGADGSTAVPVPLGPATISLARSGHEGGEASADGDQRGEANLLLRLDDLGQKAYVLAEFADSKMAAYEGPHTIADGGPASYGAERSFDRRRSPSYSSSETASGRLALTQEASEARAIDGMIAREALAIYIRSLGFLKRAIELVSAFNQASRGNGKDSGKREHDKGSSMPSVQQSPDLDDDGDGVVSAEIGEAVAYLMKRFNETVEKAEAASSRTGGNAGAAVNVNKIIYNKAMEIARAAALDELENNHTTVSVGGAEPAGSVDGTSPSSMSPDGAAAAPPTSSAPWDIHACLLAYETAEIMLASLLATPRLDAGTANASAAAASQGVDPPPSPNDTVQDSTALTIAPFLKSIGHRCQILRSRALATSGRLSSSPSAHVV